MGEDEIFYLNKTGNDRGFFEILGLKRIRNIEDWIPYFHFKIIGNKKAFVLEFYI